MSDAVGTRPHRGLRGRAEDAPVRPAHGEARASRGAGRSRGRSRPRRPRTGSGASRKARSGAGPRSPAPRPSPPRGGGRSGRGSTRGSRPGRAPRSRGSGSPAARCSCRASRSSPGRGPGPSLSSRVIGNQVSSNRARVSFWKPISNCWSKRVNSPVSRRATRRRSSSVSREAPLSLREGEAADVGLRREQHRRLSRGRLAEHLRDRPQGHLGQVEGRVEGPLQAGVARLHRRLRALRLAPRGEVAAPGAHGARPPARPSPRSSGTSRPRPRFCGA